MRQQNFSRLAFVSVVGLAISVGWTIICGQDANFDLITYHYYLGYEAFTNRLNLDFLPASYQGYQSPLPYVLLFSLNSVGVPPLVNASIHAAIQSLNLVFLLLITDLLVGDRIGSHRSVLVLGFWALGAIAPIYWSIVGTSFPDLLTTVPVLAGLWLALRGFCRTDGSSPDTRTIAGSAALIGIAAGIRLHNGIYVLGLLSAIAFSSFPDGRSRRSALAAATLGALSGWLLFFAPWALILYWKFGNPIFPLYNALFESPYFPTFNLPINSFTPHTVLELLSLPFRIATYTESIYGETPLPDVRLAVLTIGAIGCGLYAKASPATEIRTKSTSSACLRPVIIFFVVATSLWVATSTNARYGSALLLLAGPLCGLVFERLLPLRYVWVAVGAVFLWQAALQHVFFRDTRPPYSAWTSRYFDWSLEDRLKQAPATFLSFGYRTASTLAPQLHPQSSHINLVGQYTPGVDMPGSKHIRWLIERHASIYAVFDSSLIFQEVPDVNSYRTYFRSQVRLWGLDFSDAQCSVVKPRTATGTWIRLNQLLAIKGSEPLSFIICEMRRSTAAAETQALAEWKLFKQKLRTLATLCPEYFGKPLSYIRVHTTWTVTSFATYEARLDFLDDGAFYLQEGRAPYARLELGRADGNMLVPYVPDCTKWFERLAELSSEAAYNRARLIRQRSKSG